MTPKEFMENFGVIAEAAGGSRRLRALVLEMAVRGKLTARLASDEPVPTLLNRIEDEREKAVRDGVASKLVSAPPVNGDAPYGIPAEWTWVRLASLVLFTESGWSPQAEPRPRALPEWGVLKVSAVSWGAFRPGENKALSSTMKPPERAVVRNGDFLMSRANTAELVGRSVIVEGRPERLILSDKIVRCEFARSVDRCYINYFNRTLAARQHYVANASGTSDSMKNISREVILNLSIPLPALAEQRRIVVKVDQLMAMIDELEGKQGKRRQTVVRANKACLEALTSAESVEEVAEAWKRVAGNWRVLLDWPEAVGELRGAVLELAVRGRLVNAGNPRSDGDAGGPFVVPSTWSWKQIDDLCADSFYGPRFSKHDYVVDGGIPTIRTTDMTSKGEIVLRDAPRVRVEPAKLNLYRVRSGDLLVTRSGSIGTMAVFRGNYEAIPSAYLIRFRFTAEIWPEFAYACLKSPFGQELLGLGTRRVAQPNVNATSIRAMLMPVPPLAEQKSIVAKVDQLMGECDELEAKLRRRDDRAGRLVEAVVGEIVSGEGREVVAVRLPEGVAMTDRDGKDDVRSTCKKARGQRTSGKAVTM